jgi:hypothetical protein
MNREIECAVSSIRDLMENHGHPRIIALYAKLDMLCYGVIIPKEKPGICLNVSQQFNQPLRIRISKSRFPTRMSADKMANGTTKGQICPFGPDKVEHGF